MPNRIERLTKSLKKSRLDFLLVSAPSHLRYLAGYSGSNGLALISGSQRLFLTDFRYKDQVKEEVKGFQIQMAERDLYTTLGNIKKPPKGKFRLGFEAKNLTYANFLKLKEILPKAELVPTHNLVEEIVAQKEPKEIEKIKKAAEIVDQVFDEMLPEIKPGISEQDLATEIEYRMKKKGASGPAFETIVASGYRSAYPHGRASNKKLIKEKGFGPNFGHGLGHGIGVQVHESPVLNPRSSDVLKENMVVTIEPGIYISRWGGVRIEDDVLVTGNGPGILTPCHNELL